MKLLFDEDLLPSQIIIDKMMQAAEECAAMNDINPQNLEISITFVSAEEIMELNTMYRHVEKATDVLSFPQYSGIEAIKAADTGQAVTLGDVVIAPDIAFVQAEEFGHSVERELVYLFVHSILHLLGYEHKEIEDKAVMRKLEEQVMQKIGLKREE